MSKRELLLWLLAYFAIIAGIVVCLNGVRKRTLATLGTPEALAEWQAYRAAAAQQSRRVPKSPEPPALVLMRDHYPAMVGGAVFFGTALFILLGWAGRGAFTRK